MAVSRDFVAFFPWIEPTWAPDNQAKVVLLADSLSQRCSIHEKNDKKSRDTATLNLFFLFVVHFARFRIRPGYGLRDRLQGLQPKL